MAEKLNLLEIIKSAKKITFVDDDGVPMAIEDEQELEEFVSEVYVVVIGKVVNELCDLTDLSEKNEGDENADVDKGNKNAIDVGIGETCDNIQVANTAPFSAKKVGEEDINGAIFVAWELPDKTVIFVDASYCQIGEKSEETEPVSPSNKPGQLMPWNKDDPLKDPTV